MAKSQTRLERIAVANATKAAAADKFIIISAHVDSDGMIQRRTDAQKWPLGDFQKLQDMIEDDFMERRKALALKAIREKQSP